MRFIEKYLDDWSGTLAAILIMSKVTVYLSCKPNPYYERKTQIKAKLGKIEPFNVSMYEGNMFE